MSKFTVRKEQPYGNKYYMTKSTGGYNGAVYGKPLQEGANVLANCVGYANGRFNEIYAEIKGKEVFPYQLTCDAGSFIKYGKKMGLKVSQRPQAGSIMVWDGGSGGHGHVCVVEEIIDDNRVMISQSNYGGKPFEYKVRTNANGRWGLSGLYTFLGFLLNPAVNEDEPKTEYDTYIVKRGDTLYKIAASFGITLSYLEDINPQIQNPNLIHVGERINVPKQEPKPKQELKVGDLVRIQKDAPVYGRMYKFSAWVYRCSLYVRAIDGDKITVSTLKSGAITGNVDRKYLTKV